MEAIRALMVAKRSARNERTQANGQARSLIVTGPDDLRARFARHTVAALVAELAALRPRRGDVPGYATRIALRELGRRAQFLDAQLERLDELIVPLAGARAPSLLALHGIGPDTAALLLIAAGDHPERLRSEAAWAHMCAVAPIPASSVLSEPSFTVLSMAKAARALAAPKRDGWTQTRRSGSHRVLVKGDQQRIWAMMAWTWAARRWPGSPATTGIPLLSCASFRMW